MPAVGALKIGRRCGQRHTPTPRPANTRQLKYALRHAYSVGFSSTPDMCLCTLMYQFCCVFVVESWSFEAKVADTELNGTIM